MLQIPLLYFEPLTFRVLMTRSGLSGRSPYLKVTYFGTLITLSQSLITGVRELVFN